MITRHTIMTASIIVLFFTSPAIGQSTGDSRSHESNLRIIAEYDSGILYKADNLNILELHGNYHRMGRQYGMLLKDQLHKFYDSAVAEYFIKKEGFTYEEMKEKAQIIFELYPQRFKAIIDGMAETSEIEVNKLIILDQITSFSPARDKDYGSVIVTWGDYTDRRPLILGRNRSSPLLLKEAEQFLTVAVFNADDSSIPTASVAYSGQVSSLTAMNEGGLCIVHDEAICPEENIHHYDRISTNIMALAFLFDSFMMKQLDASLNTTQTDCPRIINVADRNGAYSYEHATDGIKRRPGMSGGLLVAANHFVHPDWGIKKPRTESTALSVTRRQTFLALGEKHKGTFSVETMQEVLDISVDRNGSDVPWSVYQIIAVPEELKLWLKAPHFQDWTEVDLRLLFRN